MHWYQYTKTQLEAELKTTVEKGLMKAEVNRRLVQYGPNMLPEAKSESWLHIFVRQFQSPLIYILLICAVAVYILGDTNDSVIILAVLLFNALIGAVQEGRTNSTLKSLKKLSEAECVVLRNGEEEVVHEHQVVPGDILLLQEGQKVVADARVVLANNLSTDEAALTGESGSVHKTAGNFEEQNLPASAQHNIVFKGTAILTGDGRAVVVGTGEATEIGKISKALQGPQEEIPLQKNIRKLSRVIIYAVLGLSAVLYAVGIWSGRGAVEMFSVVVSLAVSMIPEGLPLVLTLILVTGVWRMSKRNALIKKMQAVEALGQANILAVDKTGTLTKNEMTVKKIFTGGNIYHVQGSGYEPKGHVKLGDQIVPVIGDVALSGTIASLASRGSARFSEEDGKYKVIGDPTEAAMFVLGEKLGQSRELLSAKFREVAEIAFDYKNKFRAVFYDHEGEIFCAVAGAPEVIIGVSQYCVEQGQAKTCTLEGRAVLEAAVEEFSQSGLRVVGFGFKRLQKNEHLDDIQNLVFGGLLGIEDSVRPEAVSAVKRAQEAGVKVVMITGDHKNTAKAIAKEAGIFTDHGLVMTGAELDELSNEDLAEKLPRVCVFARVTPEDKMKIIKAYKQAGLVVAMTGDGVNDAPSLVAADLGVAMGKIGTEVAKDAADIVLLDDNLSSIVAAIEEGRSMYRNIQKALQFLFSTSLGELLAILVALILHFKLPVLAVQILWLNLVTDPLIGTALALDKKEPNILKQKFEKLPGYFITRTMVVQMAIVASVMAGVGLYLFSLYQEVNYVKATTVILTSLAMLQWFHAFNSQHYAESVFSARILRNPYLWLAIALNIGLQIIAVHVGFFQKLLKTTSLAWQEWVLIAAFSFAIILAEEVRKIFFKALKIQKSR